MPDVLYISFDLGIRFFFVSKPEKFQDTEKPKSMPVSFYSAGGFYGFLCGFLRTSIRIVGFCPRLFSCAAAGPNRTYAVSRDASHPAGCGGRAPDSDRDGSPVFYCAASIAKDFPKEVVLHVLDVPFLFVPLFGNFSEYAVRRG